MNFLKFLIFGVLILTMEPSQVQAMNLSQNFNFDGVLVDAANVPMTGPVSIKFQIYEHGGTATCLLFEEDHTSVTLDSSGHFTVKIGSGTRVSAATDGGLEFKSIFQNNAEVRASASPNCTGGYTPATGDSRDLKVTVNSTALSPMYTLSPTPMALVAETLQGKTVSDFVSRTDTATQTVNGPIKLMDNSQSFGVSLIAPSSMASNVTYTLPGTDGTSGQVLSTDGSGLLSWLTSGGGGTVTNVTGTAPISVASGTTTPVISLSTTAVTPGTYGSTTQIPSVSVDSYGRLTNVSLNTIAAITSLNGLSDATQTFGSVGTSGLAPSWTSAGGTHSLNIPMASSASVTAGLISKTDYDAFNGKLSSSGGSMSGALSVTGNISSTATITASSFSGNGSGLTGVMITPAGSANQIQYNNSGVLGATSNMYWDSTNSRLGVGTASPTTKLEVNGVFRLGLDSSEVCGTLGDKGKIRFTDTPYRLQFCDGGAWGDLMVDTGATTYIQDGGQAGPLWIGTSSADNLILGTNTIGQVTINSTGNVGIGTTTPSKSLSIFKIGSEAALQLNTTSGSAASMTYYQQAAKVAQVGWAPSAVGFEVGTTGTDPLIFKTNGTETMRILSNGYVGIGKTTPSYALDVNGAVAGTLAYVQTSDRRFKRDIASLTNSLNKISQIQGVSYRWKSEEFPDKKFSDRTDLGVIAQDIEPIFPEAVSTDKNGFKTVAYSMLIAPLIEAVKELKDWLSSQNEELQHLKAENQLMKDYLCQKDPQAPFCSQ